jgi:hypothetical protein
MVKGIMKSPHQAELPRRERLFYLFFLGGVDKRRESGLVNAPSLFCIKS